MAGFVEETGRRHGVEEPLQMTVAVSDGERSTRRATRAGRSSTRSSSPPTRAPSARCYPEDERFRAFSDEARAVVSEPLGDLPGLWHEVPAGTALVVQPGEDEQVPFAPRRAG